MTVRTALNFEPLLNTADETWPEWTASEPVLGQFTCTQDILTWRVDACWRAEREVLLALGRLTLNEQTRLEATSVLVGLVLPACEPVVAARARKAADARHVEEVAAGYLWAAVAEYPWDDPLRGWIPQGVARQVGRALDREFGWGSRAERAWRDRADLTPDLIEELPQPGGERPLNTTSLYWWALAEVGIPREDLDLVVALAVKASEDSALPRGSAGIASRWACRQLAGPGESTNQVQYRAVRTLRQLRKAAHPAA